MSKKNKRKNKDKTLSWAKFIRKFCSRCVVCTSNINAKFCHGLYLKDPKGWKEDIFPTLSKSTSFLSTGNNNCVSGGDFVEVFCSVCGVGNSSMYKPCDDFTRCFAEFNKQIRDSGSSKYGYVCKKQKEEPKPVFFTNNPEKWDIIIKKTLYGEKE